MQKALRAYSDGDNAVFQEILARESFNVNESRKETNDGRTLLIQVLQFNSLSFLDIPYEY